MPRIRMRPASSPVQVGKNLRLPLDPIRDGYCVGSGLTTTGGITSTQTALTLAAAEDFQNGQAITVAGAGAAGALLRTTIVSGGGTVNLVLAAAAGTTVAGALVTHDDSAGLTSACSDAVAANRPVRLSQGTYMLGANVTLPSGLSMRGVGRKYTILRAVVGVSGGGILQAVNDVNTMDLRYFTVDGNSANAEGIYCPYSAGGATDVTIQRVTVQNTGGLNNSGIDMGTVSTRTRVEGCLLTGCSGPGVALGEPTDAIVRGCIFSGNLANPSNAGGSIADLNIAYIWHRVTISDCHFYDSGQAFAYTAFIQANQSGGASGLCEELSISNCVCATTGFHGILIYQNQAAGDIEGVDITGCQVRGAGASNGSGSGIYVFNAAGGTMNGIAVTGCTVDQSGGYGIEVQSCTNVSVSGCQAMNGADPGFYMGNLVGFSVTGCTSKNGAGALGFEITNCSDGTISGCTATGNDWGGIGIENCTGVTISGNTSSGNGVGPTVGAGAWENSGIYLDATTSHCTVVGNTCRNQSRVSGSANVRAGIRLYGATYCLVQGNVCTDTQGTKTQDYGVYEDNGANENTIQGNDLRGNLTGALSLVGASTTASGNRGYNPVGALAAPAIPATTVAQTNTFAVRTRVFVTGGTVAALAINGTATGLTSGSFELDPGETITLTYSAAPTWTWFGL